MVWILDLGCVWILGVCGSWVWILDLGCVWILGVDCGSWVWILVVDLGSWVWSLLMPRSTYEEYSSPIALIGHIYHFLADSPGSL
jgi:hypothetical protein